MAPKIDQRTADQLLPNLDYCYAGVSYGTEKPNDGELSLDDTIVSLTSSTTDGGDTVGHRITAKNEADLEAMKAAAISEGMSTEDADALTLETPIPENQIGAVQIIDTLVPQDVAYIADSSDAFILVSDHQNPTALYQIGPGGEDDVNLTGSTYESRYLLARYLTTDNADRRATSLTTAQIDSTVALFSHTYLKGVCFNPSGTKYIPDCVDESETPERMTRHVAGARHEVDGAWEEIGDELTEGGLPSMRDLKAVPTAQSQLQTALTALDASLDVFYCKNDADTNYTSLILPEDKTVDSRGRPLGTEALLQAKQTYCRDLTR